MRKKLFRKGLVFVLMLVFVTTSMLPGAIGDNDYNCDIWVPDDYPTIQDAIDAAVSGSTICVRCIEGHCIYYENIKISSSSLTVEGIDSGLGSPTIEGGRKGNAVSITADHCRFHGFKINNANEDGILIYGVSAHHNEVFDNEIERSQHNGIVIDYGHNNTISNNILTNNGIATHPTFDFDGIWILHAACDNVIEDNNIDTVTGTGIDVGGGYQMEGGAPYYAGYCHRNHVIGNVITNADHDGIFVNDHSNENAIENNIITNCGIGPYWGDGNGIDIGWYCSNNIVSYNKIEGIVNRAGIIFDEGACDNIISFNEIIETHDNGIELYPYACNNIFFNNTIRNNMETGIHVSVFACENVFYYNSVLNNGKNAFDQNSPCCNDWNSKEKMYYRGEEDYVGNYWSDYTGLEGDNGRGNICYEIPQHEECNKDRYPIGVFEVAYIQWLYPDPDEPALYILGKPSLFFDLEFNWIIGGIIIEFDINPIEEGWEEEKASITCSVRERDSDYCKGLEIYECNLHYCAEWTGKPYGWVEIKVEADCTNDGSVKHICKTQWVWHNLRPPTPREIST